MYTGQHLAGHILLFHADTLNLSSAPTVDGLTLALYWKTFMHPHNS